MLRLEIPSCRRSSGPLNTLAKAHYWASSAVRSEEHTSELQSLRHLVCRLLLEKKKKKNTTRYTESTYRDFFRHCTAERIHASATSLAGDPCVCSGDYSVILDHELSRSAWS